MRIARHKIDVDASKERFENRLAALPSNIAAAKKYPKNLSLVATEILDIVKFGSVVAPDSPEIPKALRIAAQALTNLFAIARAVGDSVVLPFGDDENCVFPVEKDESIVEPSKWIQGFCLASICRDSRMLDSLCETPSADLRKSSTTNPEYRCLLVDAIQGYWTESEDTAKRTIAALEATDPERPDISARDWVLNIDVPFIECLFRAISGDEAFADSLPKAIQLHNEFWTATNTRKKDWDGFVSFGLTAMAALGDDHGVPFDIESDYLLMRFVRDPVP